MMSNLQYQVQQKNNFITMTLPNTNKIIQHLQKVQFVCQFFILSKYSESHHAVPEMLMVIQAFKFYFKSIAIAQSKGIYLQSTNEKLSTTSAIEELNEEHSTIDEEIQRQKKILDLIKQKPYQSNDLYPKMFERMGTGKQMQLVTAVELPKQLKKTQLSFRHIMGELLTVLRPLVSIICIRLYGIDSYKSYFISLVIDIVIILVFQKGLKVTSEEEKKQINRRKSEMIRRYLFRKPFFEVLKRLLIQPLLARIIKPDRFISKIIMKIFEMQSSISLTL